MHVDGAPRAGCVTLDVGGADVVLRDWRGADITAAVPGSGTEVARIELWDRSQARVVRAYGRNDAGSFYQVFQPNKWRQKQALDAAGRRTHEAALV
jgi:hypothetical protein